MPADISAQRPLGEITETICQDITKELKKSLVQDLKFVIDDIRQQYRDHNNLLARQEMVVQQLLEEMHRVASHSSRKTNGSKGGNGKSAIIKTPRSAFCADVEWTASEDYLIETPAPKPLRTPSAEVAPQLRLETEYQPWVEWSLGNGITEKRADGAQRALDKDVWRPIDPRMCPRPSPAPPLPYLYPHTSPEQTLTPRGGGDACADIKAEAGLPREPARVTIDTDSLRRCGGDDGMLDIGLPDASNILEETESDKNPGNEEAPYSSTSAGSAGPRYSVAQGVAKGIEKGKTFLPQRGGCARGSVKKNKALFGEVPVDKSNLDQEDYNVCNLYHETGISQRIARSDLFGNITLAVIAANAMYIGIDADNNHEENLVDADIGFQICEHLFCVFFTFEWLVRFGAFKNKLDCRKDMWFRFDSALVAMMVVETWILPIALAGSGGIGIPTGLVKMLRLLRLARMARLMRAFPELVAMIKGVKVASRAVGSALLMLIMLVYVFSIVMFTLLKEESDPMIKGRFDRLGDVMWTLLIDGTFLDGVGYVTRALMRVEQFVPLIVFMIFVLASALTVMNMLIGVLCEVVSAVAAHEKEDNAIRIVKEKLLFMLKEMDEDGSGEISRSEMHQVLDNGEALKTLESLKVDVIYLIDQLDMLFEDGDDLTIYQIMDLILMLRGDRPPTMKDMLHAQTFNRWKLGKALADQSEEMSAWLESFIAGGGGSAPTPAPAPATPQQASGFSQDTNRALPMSESEYDG